MTEKKEGEEAEKLEDLRLPESKEEEVEELKPAEPKKEQEGFLWTNEVVMYLGDLVRDIFKEIGIYTKDKAEAQRKYFESVSSHNRWMIGFLLLFLSAIVVGMTCLAYLGTVSGDALLFLVGTITGYALLFIQRLVFPSKETPPTEEET